MNKVIFLSLLPIISALPQYPQRLPNGFKVPHPCFDGATWKGVGHKNHQGGGMLNAFGEDFRKNDFKWDECLCKQDSDGDGRTNGEELGDPDCQWTGDGDPVSGENLGHPGICEPLDSEECKDRNDWEVCTAIDFICPGIDDPETEKLDFRFTEIVVPATETNYYCYAVEFDDTVDMHAFAMAPIVDNELVVHHIDMNACENEESERFAKIAFGKPRPCAVMNPACNTLIAAWQLGINGICLNDDVGIRVGKWGVKVAVLRIHYHNPTFLEGEKDTSGLSMFVTTDVRPYDATVINFSQKFLEIPPGQPAHDAFPIDCGPFCTDTFTTEVNIIFATMHMHLLGTGGRAEHWRDGQKVQDIMVQDFYDYNSPQLKNFDPPLVIKPGDTIKHLCSFESLDRTEVTWRGQSVFDEMCHLYLVHYPAQNLTNCDSDGKTPTCKFKHDDTVRDYESQGCDYSDFKDVYENYLRDELMSVCDVTGMECLPGCPEMLEWAYNNHSCLSGEAKYSCFRRNDELKFMQSSCKEYPPPQVPKETTTLPPGDCVFGKAHSYKSNSGLVILLALLMVGRFID